MKRTAFFLAFCILHSAFCIAQSTETGGASGFAGGSHASRTLGAAWASNNHVRADSAYEDYDNDLLENLAEEALGTSPWTNDLTAANAASAIALGALDLVPAKWKAHHGFALADVVGDSDPDNDGWDNWAEWMAGSDPLSATNRPDPVFRCTVDLGRLPARGRLVVHAYSRSDMNGWPDAVYGRDLPPGASASVSVVDLRDADLVYGHLRQGHNWFFAWVNEDGSNLASVNGGDWPTWTGAEPAAIADNQLDGIDMGFDLNEITFHLTDKAESFARFSWENRMPAPGDVHVAIIYSGNQVFDRVIKWPRTWLHEGDIISWNQEHSGNSRKNFGLGAQEGSLSANDEIARAFVAVLTPQRDFEAEQWSSTPFCEISNWVHTVSALATRVLYDPIDYKVVTAARPEFKFRLDPEFTEFRFRLVTRINESGEWVNDNMKTLYDERVLAPGRFINDATHERDLVVFKSPLSVGDTWTNGVTFEAGKTYHWAVNAFSPGVKNGTSTVVQNIVIAASSTGGTSDALLVRLNPRPATGASAARVSVWRDAACANIMVAAAATNDQDAALCRLPVPRGGPYFVKAQSGARIGYVGGRRPVPVFAEVGVHSITNEIILRSIR